MARLLREFSSKDSGSRFTNRELPSCLMMVAQPQQTRSYREALEMGRAGMEFHGGEDRCTGAV